VKAYAERDKREADGIGDRWSEMQRSVMPDIDSTLVGFRIEKLFEYSETDGTTYLDWCHREVILVNSDKIKYATIRWNEDCLRPGDCSTTREKLLQIGVPTVKSSKIFYCFSWFFKCGIPRYVCQ
jgi:hypothetical protein